jgi:transcriptional regulator with XRE-family HTH domain
MTITPEQCRAARALLDWSQPDLVGASGIGRSTITRFERGVRMPHPKNLAAIRAALEAGGVEFLDPNCGGPGLRLRGKSGPDSAS